jgi:hypothetical protein
LTKGEIVGTKNKEGGMGRGREGGILLRPEYSGLQRTMGEEKRRRRKMYYMR